MMLETVGISAGKAGDKDIVWTVWKHTAVPKRTVKRVASFNEQNESYGLLWDMYWCSWFSEVSRN